MTERRHCAELEDSCPANPLREADPDGAFRCPMHSTAPAVVAQRTGWQRKGGLSTLRTLAVDRPKADLTTPRGLRRELRELIHAVVTGQLAPEVGKVAIFGLGVAVKLGELELHGLIGDLEKRAFGRRLSA
jgi:hypothetical protein